MEGTANGNSVIHQRPLMGGYFVFVDRGSKECKKIGYLESTVNCHISRRTDYSSVSFIISNIFLGAYQLQLQE
jgi:hypothetical protein